MRRYQSKLYRVAYFWLMQEEYDRWAATDKAEPALSSAAVANRDEAIGANAFRDHLETFYEITKDENDFVSTKDIMEDLKSIGVKGDDKYYARELAKTQLGLTHGRFKGRGVRGWYGLKRIS